MEQREATPNGTVELSIGMIQAGRVAEDRPALAMADADTFSAALEAARLARYGNEIKGHTTSTSKPWKPHRTMSTRRRWPKSLKTCRTPSEFWPRMRNHCRPYVPWSSRTLPIRRNCSVTQTCYGGSGVRRKRPANTKRRWSTLRTCADTVCATAGTILDGRSTGRENMPRFYRGSSGRLKSKSPCLREACANPPSPLRT